MAPLVVTGVMSRNAAHGTIELSPVNPVIM